MPLHYFDAVIGDKTPSQFMWYLKSLGATELADSVFKYLWMRQLPQQVQAILTVILDKDVEYLARTADTIMDVYNLKPKSAEEIQKEQLAALSAELEKSLSKIVIRKDVAEAVEGPRVALRLKDVGVPAAEQDAHVHYHVARVLIDGVGTTVILESMHANVLPPALFNIM